MSVETLKAIEMLTENENLEAVSTTDKWFSIHSENFEGAKVLCDQKGHTFDTINLGLNDTWEIRERK